MIEFLFKEIVPCSSAFRRSAASVLTGLVAAFCIYTHGVSVMAAVALVGMLNFTVGMDRGSDIYKEAFKEVHGLTPVEAGYLAGEHVKQLIATKSRPLV